METNKRNYWKELSLSDKAQLFPLFIEQGITSPKDIADIFNDVYENELYGNHLENLSTNKGLSNTFGDGGNLYGLGSWIKSTLSKNYKTPTFGEAFSQAKAAGDEYFKWNGNRYNTQTEVEQWRENHPETRDGAFAIDNMVQRIQNVENSKDNPKGGYVAETDRWYPHDSYEGGNKTVAWGFKLGQNPDVDEILSTQGYLTGNQADSILTSRAEKDLINAKKIYDKKFGEGEWDKLSPNSQSILGDYQFNPGLSTFPKLMQGFHDKDLDKIYKNYKRYSRGKPLGRNKIIKEELDKIKGGYFSIYK